MDHSRYRNALVCKGNVTCLCSKCVYSHELEYQKETLRTDCEDCYVQKCPVLGDYIPHYCGEHVPSPPPRKENPKKADQETEYAFTLNMPPGHASESALIKAAESILRHGLTPSAPYEKPCYGAYVVETTEVGTPHVHGVYKTPSGRRISSKYFKRYWPLWDEKVHLGHGHKGGYHQKARHAESYSAYMAKEGVVVPVAAPVAPEIISHL